MQPILRVALIPLLVLASAMVTSAQLPEAGDKPLSSLRGKNRVLLVFAPSEKDANYQEQLKLWQKEKEGFLDRDLVIYPVLADGKKESAEAPELLRRRYKVKPDVFEVVLIGKDGHDAYSTTKPVPAETLYSRIDSMPMRKEEMKAKRPSNSRQP